MKTNSVIDAIGNTPLIKLKYPSEITGCEIYGKAEFMNPGGSVKDRTALGIILDAEEKGLLEPNGQIIESSFGNTAIGLALVANARGYKLKIVMPNITVPSKRDIIKNMGAELMLVDALPFSNPGNYQRVAERITKEENEKGNKIFWASQFENLANYKFHEKTTAKEIYDQTNGLIDGFTCAIGTGGTLTGVGNGLKNLNNNVKIACTDSQGSSMFKYFTEGIPEKKGDESITDEYLYEENNSETHSDVVRWHFLLPSILIMVFPMIFLSGSATNPGVMVELTILGTVATIYYSNGVTCNKNLSFSITPILFLGKISYSVYLWHFVLFSYARIYFGEPSQWIKGFIIFGTLAISAVSFYFIERKPSKFRYLNTVTISLKPALFKS